jgi:anti-sigma-K factor RskA
MATHDDTEEMEMDPRERARAVREQREGRRSRWFDAWKRLEKWQQVFAISLGAVGAIFAAGVTFQKARASVVLVSVQKLVDDRQDVEIQAVLNDNALLHVSQEHLHEEVRGMRLDIRSFDPRRIGGGLPDLEDEPEPRSAGTGGR